MLKPTASKSMDKELYMFTIYGVLLNIVTVFGIFGNVVFMIILSRPQMRSSISLLLISLASSDTLLIITISLVIGLPNIHQYNNNMFEYYYKVYPRILPYAYPTMKIAQTMTVYLTVMVSIERYIVVCHPLRARSWCTHKRAKICVIAIAIFSFFYNLPRFWEISYESRDTNNTTLYHAYSTPLCDDPIYYTVYNNWMGYVFLYFLPFVLLAVLNVFIYKDVRRANADRQRLSSQQKHEIRLARMLICVVLVFFFCYVLALVIYLTLDSKNVMLKAMGILLITINSCVNFIIYVIFFKNFRRLFLHMFLCGKFDDVMD